MQNAQNEGGESSCRAASLVRIPDLEIPRHEHPNVHYPKRGIAGGERESKRRNGTYANRFCQPGCDKVSQISKQFVIEINIVRD